MNSLCVPVPNAAEIQHQHLIKRVPPPALSAKALAALQIKLGLTQCEKVPNAILAAAMEGERTNWTVVKRMAALIADPKYTLTNFWEDLQAFPELHL
eukprot:CAMPEP_0172660718 /NCGR_PEP_ID=MMETSP1074-20121228/4217_1 /TAXON_ID=2916 /ORGANISM="Ceratium fusus, Strain PA161109" /LENGTH=96 /DNA_ID=CAMNT_0013476357 /DNA_START=115 /DNA_END=402 /DNA_ORIENTATION=-